MKLNVSAIPLKYDNPYWTSTAWEPLKEYILYSLGWPVVRIELTEQNLLLCIHDAISKYMKWGSHVDVHLKVLPVDNDGFVSLIDTLTPENSIDPGLVQEVVFISKSLNYAWGTELLGELAVPGYLNGNADFYNLTDLSFDVTRYVLWKKQLDDANDVLNLNKHWEIINDKVKVYPNKSVITDGEVGIIYGKIPTPEGLSSDDWVRDYSVARAKHLLGTIRGKFSGFNAPGGQAATDGETLKAEANEAMRALIDELKAERPALPFMQF